MHWAAVDGRETVFSLLVSTQPVTPVPINQLQADVFCLWHTNTNNYLKTEDDGGRTESGQSNFQDRR